MQEVKALLVGNPNTGKTTLFNTLTKSDEHVGNWHGVTVEEKEKKYEFNDSLISLVDLPGLYSLTALSYEEEVSRDYFLQNPEMKIINICDASNLRRNLYLTLNLLEFKSKAILAINQLEKKPKYKIDLNKLKNMLGIDAVLIDAKSKESVQDLNEKMLKAKMSLLPKYVEKFNLSKLKQLICKFFPAEKLDFFAIKCLEKDEKVLSNLPKNVLSEVLKILPSDSIELVAKTRYEFIDNVLKNCTIKTEKVYGKSKLDSILMNKFLALPIFLLIFAGIFYLTFFSLGRWISDGLVSLVDLCIKTPVSKLFSSLNLSNTFVSSLFEDAVIGGVGTVFAFLPQVVLLFMFLSILEDSGYLSRVAFCFEDIFSKIGLSGKSVYTLLMGFGCSSTAVLTSRTMEDKNAKIKTALLTPYMSCSAKFPIYVVIGGAFFGAKNIFVIMGLYLLGVVISILLSLVLDKTFLKSKEQSFILEFPTYKIPSLKSIAKVLLKNLKDFVLRIGTVLIAMNVLVFVLSKVSFSFCFVENGEGSMLQTLGKILAPIFVPLGFGSWGAVSALLAGVVAKEVIVSSVAMFNKSSFESLAKSLINPLSAVFFQSYAGALSFLVFCLLYCPCVSTTTVLLKEIGKKWTFVGIILQLLIAYFTSFIFFNLAKFSENFGVFFVLLSLVCFLTILFSALFVIKKIKRKNLCFKNCNKCEHCKND